MTEIIPGMAPETSEEERREIKREAESAIVLIEKAKKALRPLVLLGEAWSIADGADPDHRIVYEVNGQAITVGDLRYATAIFNIMRMGACCMTLIEQVKDVLKQWDCSSCSGMGQKDIFDHPVQCSICKGSGNDPRAASALAALSKLDEGMETTEEERNDLADEIQGSQANDDLFGAALLRDFDRLLLCVSVNPPAIEFAVGDRVEKFTGDYHLLGEVRAVWTTKAGKLRYTVEHYGGICHIYSEANLRAAGESVGGKDAEPIADTAPMSTAGTPGNSAYDQEGLASETSPGLPSVTAPSASRDRHSEASASRRENNNDRSGERPEPSPGLPTDEIEAMVDRLAELDLDEGYITDTIKEAAALLRRLRPQGASMDPNFAGSLPPLNADGRRPEPKRYASHAAIRSAVLAEREAITKIGIDLPDNIRPKAWIEGWHDGIAAYRAAIRARH